MAMNKTQQWERVQEILEGTKISKAKMAELAEVLAPKTGGGIKHPIVTIDGVEMAYCRYTAHYWPLESMVYQNEEKREAKVSKGYSKIGISLWTKGQKYLRDLQAKASKALEDDKVEEAKEFAKEYKDIVATKKANDAKWLAQFATEEQEAAIEAHPENAEA